ncbi:MAG: hypothetical protein KKF46_02235 [Nanoarchaeota archaeon]|nr:hypothetical protein [Nanoarchaeota archaeon]MBU1321153.1 hypothetical protein [Nanoarchaeota archaeon]MBU1597482.1 hypothetical protein [Nanoarchaeota archaeon]MBU2441856.1 hypothetical protein [Nanoarchaeota archaeon]
MRKGQAALEFLTTYGWAFIVILVMIGALAYFGVLNPSKVLPNKCTAEAGFSCKDYRILSTNVSVVLSNGKGGGFTVGNVTAESDAGKVQGCEVTPSSTVPVDSEFTITCDDGTDLSTAVGEKVKVTFEMSYIMARGTYNQSFRGEIYSEVR